MEFTKFLILIIKQSHVIFLPWHHVSFIEANDSSTFNSAILNQIFEHDLSLIEKFLCFDTHSFIIEDFGVGAIRVLSSDLPSHEKWIPINILHHFFKIEIFEDSSTCKSRFCDLNIGPMSFKFLRPRFC